MTRSNSTALTECQGGACLFVSFHPADTSSPHRSPPMPWDWKSAFDWKKPGPTKERLAIGGGVLVAVLAIAAAAGAFEQEPGMNIVQGTPSAEADEAGED